MKNEVSDERFDELLQKLMSEATLDESAVNDIADSPAMWWGVQRRITEQKAAKSPWPPVLKRWLLIAVPAAAAVLVALLVFINRTPMIQPDLAKEVSPQPMLAETSPSVDVPAEPKTANTVETGANPRHNARPLRAVTVARRSPVRTEPAIVKKGRSINEIKTDFIALTYARDPDSGQIVRVRVPSSMMVTLGLVSSVEKPTQMVDAEVLVGDDGLTRAIRFIHK